MSGEPSPIDLPLREDLRGNVPYGAPQIDVPVRLNTNENPHPVPVHVADAVAAAVAAQVRGLNRYPDREFTELRGALAAYASRVTGVAQDADRLWAGNGSNEVLQHLFLAFGGPGRTALGFVPSYSMHGEIAGVTATSWARGSRGPWDGPDPFGLTADDAVAQVRRYAPDMVFLCSPNNPTGTALDLRVVRAVLAAAPRAVVVVDEAYGEFARPGTPSAATLLADHPLLVVTRTMSKAFAFAGARVGYLLADARVTAALRLVRLPYHLSSLTQAAAVAALRHADDMLATVAATVAQRDRITAAAGRRGLRPVPSDANFVLIGGFADATAAWRALLDRGVLVRDVGLPGHLRASAGTPAETDAFLAALEDLVTTDPATIDATPQAVTA
ncbi:MAG: histidinol-phosphate transaminase [Kineosporiaceae bacterium]